MLWLRQKRANGHNVRKVLNKSSPRSTQSLAKTEFSMGGNRDLKPPVTALTPELPRIAKGSCAVSRESTYLPKLQQVRKE